LAKSIGGLRFRDANHFNKLLNSSKLMPDELDEPVAGGRGCEDASADIGTRFLFESDDFDLLEEPSKSIDGFVCPDNIAFKCNAEELFGCC
jgi:hypothetical protein